MFLTHSHSHSPFCFTPSPFTFASCRTAFVLTCRQVSHLSLFLLYLLGCLSAFSLFLASGALATCQHLRDVNLPRKTECSTRRADKNMRPRRSEERGSDAWWIEMVFGPVPGGSVVPPWLMDELSLLSSSTYTWDEWTNSSGPFAVYLSSSV